MIQDSIAPSDGGFEHPAAVSWRICFTGGILAALLFLAAWLPTHPARPPLPTDDLYTNLSVARHLVRGEGFQTDVSYPLSFAFPFARELPQPLIHRQPGFAVLLTVPYLAAGKSPRRTVDLVRHLQIFLLGLIVMTGTAVFLRRGHRAAVIVWLVLLFANPLLAFAVDWGMAELACSLLLLVLWMRTGGCTPGRPNWIDGLLAGMVSMLRLDLFWVPILWWILLRRNPRQDSPGPASTTRRLILVTLAWFLVITPWAIRNLHVTGQPVFSLQAYAEHVKDTRAWPGYTVYRQLQPQPFFETMTSDPVPVLRKVGRGMKFFWGDLHRLVPLPVLLGLIYGTLAFLAAWLKILSARPGHHTWDPKIGMPTTSRTSTVALAVLTTALLTVQYSFFDHNLRHLLIVLPVMLWEFSFWIGSLLQRIIPDRQEDRGWRYRFLRNGGAVIVLPAAVAWLSVFLFPCRLPGWEFAAKEAVHSTARIEQRIEFTRRTPPGVLFVDNSAVPWFIDRPAVWSPTQKTTRNRICEFLDQPEAKP